MTETTERIGQSFMDILDADTHPVRDALRTPSPLPPGNTRVPTAVYTSQEYHDLEVEKLWSRVWQLACLEEEVPNVGDHYIYDVAHLSFLIIRTEDGIKCYRNACLHRGRRLKDHDGHDSKSIRCNFHGWHWNLDGTLREIPAQWDFPSIDPQEYCLDEALVDTWHGFVFINPDLTCTEPLADYLEGLDTQHELLPFEQRAKVAHVEKIMPVNWKACQEAFMESYHVIATHPTLALRLGDSNTRYDAYKNFSRAISPGGVLSPHLIGVPVWDQPEDAGAYRKRVHPFSGAIYERQDEDRVIVTDRTGRVGTFTKMGEWLDGELKQADPHLCLWVGGPLLDGMEDTPIEPEPPEGQEPRAWAANMRRKQLAGQWGDLIDVENFSDCEMIDSIYYSVFPNWSPWGAFNTIMYRFRPHGDNPDECIFEVMYFVPAPDPDKRPPLPKITRLGIDDDWTLATELGATVKIFQQDSLNLPQVQKGLKTQGRGEIILASENETKIRHFYDHYFRQLEIGEVPVNVNGF